MIEKGKPEAPAFLDSHFRGNDGFSREKGKPEAPAFLDSHFRGKDGLMVGMTVSNGIAYSAAPKMATEQVKEPGRPPRLWVKPKWAFCNWRAAALPCNCL